MFQYKLLFWKLKLLQSPFCNHSRAQNEKVAQQTQAPNLISANTFSTREPSFHIETLLTPNRESYRTIARPLKKDQQILSSIKLFHLYSTSLVPPNSNCNFKTKIQNNYKKLNIYRNYFWYNQCHPKSWSLEQIL